MPSQAAGTSTNPRDSDATLTSAARNKPKSASVPFINIDSPTRSAAELIPVVHPQAPSSNTAVGMASNGENRLTASAIQAARTAGQLEDNPVRARAKSVQAMTLATQAHLQAEVQAQAGLKRSARAKVKDKVRRLILRKLVLKLLLGRQVAEFVYPWVHLNKAAEGTLLPPS